MNLVYVLLLMGMGYMHARAEEQQEVKKEDDGWRWCSACMDSSFLKYSALYRNPDIGRILVPPGFRNYSCSKGTHLRVRCKDACIIVKIGNINVKEGDHPREHFFIDCSTYMLRTHVELTGDIDPSHIRDSINFTDTFQQINKTVEYKFVMDDVEEEDLWSIVGIKGGKDGLEPQKGMSGILNSISNAMFLIIFVSAVSILTCLTYYWQVIVQFFINIVKCQKSSEEPSAELQLDEVAELQSRIQI